MARVRQRLQTFDDASRFLGINLRRKIAHSTFVVQGGCDRIDVILYDTAIVTYHRNGRIRLYSGGWRTNTTKDRINKLSPYTVVSVDGEWEVFGLNDSARFEDLMLSDEDGGWQEHKDQVFRRERELHSHIERWYVRDEWDVW